MLDTVVLRNVEIVEKLMGESGPQPSIPFCGSQLGFLINPHMRVNYFSEQLPGQRL
jgi:hypothetical protein